MASSQIKLNKLVKLIHMPDWTANKIAALMTSANINKTFKDEPLIVHYLRECTVPNFNVLTGFARNDCDFNVQGDDGQTPLQTLVSKTNPMYGNEGQKTVRILVTNGADPCVVGNHGNNVLMVVVLSGQYELVSYLRLSGRAIVKRHVTQNSKLGYNVLTLFLLSGYKHVDSDNILEHLNACSYYRNSLEIGPK